MIRPATILKQLAESSSLPAAPSPQPTEHGAEQSTSEQPFHRHVTEAANDEISRQAEEILQRLNANKATQENPVSHETDVNSNFEKNSNLTQDPDSIQPRSPATQIKTPDDQSEQILREIRQQHDMLRKTNETPMASTSSAHDQPVVERIEYPLREPTDHSLPANVHRDDAEMIIVTRGNETSPPSQNEEPKIPFPETPVTKGQAERMDYQKLFDQLRNVNQQPNEQ